MDNLQKNTNASNHPLVIESIRAIHGANYYSAGPVILLRLNLGSYDERFTNTLQGFYEQLESHLPSLYEHHCSEGKPGGFFKRVQDGTLLGHVAEHVAIELQTLAGMDVRFGKTRATQQQGVYNVVYRFFDEQAGIVAGKTAIDLLNSLLMQQSFDVNHAVEKLIAIRENNMPGPSTQAIIDQARERSIPVIRLDSYNLVQLGTGKYQKRIRATLSPTTSYVAVDNMKDSFLSSLMLRNAGIPVADTLLAENLDEVLAFHKKTDKPLVLKTPINEKQRSVFPALNDKDSLKRAFETCSKYSKKVLVQVQVAGETFRLLVINGKFEAACRLTKPEVIGNGEDTIEILIERLNQAQKRKEGDKSSLTKIQPDEQTDELLAFYGYNLQTVPDQGVRIVLSQHSSPLLGALTEDVTGTVHPLNRFLAERAAQVSGLDVAGVNIICPDISRPIPFGQGVVLNVLAAPDFRMHINPWKGKPRKVARAFVDMIYPESKPSRIPVFSVTGSAGKSVCAYLVSFMLEKHGYKTGLAHSDGIFSSGRKIVQGDMAEHHGTRLILQDPGIDCAVLETAVESISKDGLGYDNADVGIILNAHPQYLPSSELSNEDDIAYTQNVIAEGLVKGGTAILNAGDTAVTYWKDRIHERIALFQAGQPGEFFLQHTQAGSRGIALENDTLILWHDGKRKPLVKIDQLPIVAHAYHKIFMESLMAAVLAVDYAGIPADKAVEYLKDFKPAAYTLHGRLAMAKLKDNLLLIDRPATQHSLAAIKQIIDDTRKEPVLYVDLSGNLPEDFKTALLREFSGIAVKVFLFFSAMHGAEDRIATVPGNNTIVSLNEYYLEETSGTQHSKQQILTHWEESKSTDPATTSFAVLDNVADLIRQLHTQQPTKIHVLFTWNFIELYQSLKTEIDFL